MVSFEKGWLPEAYRSGKSNALTKAELALHMASRIKWKSLVLALFYLVCFTYGIVKMTQDVVTGFPALQKENKAEYLKSEMMRYEPVEVVVKKGETAWEIQKRLTPSENDLRHPMGLIEEVNGYEVDWGKLRAGEKVIFLKNKN